MAEVWDTTTSQAPIPFPGNKIDIAIGIKTVLSHHTITMDPWSLHSQMREWGPNFHLYPEHTAKMGRMLEDRRQQLDTLCQSTCGDILVVPVSVGAHGPSCN